MDKRIISVFLILVLNAGFVFAETGIEKKETENEKPLTVNMEEVVVTAYGKQTKGALTGASTTISGPELTNIPVTSITSALMGKSPGLQSTLSDGQPGSSPSLRIRGFGSVNASNEPLYVVDGYVYSGAISDINPQDIESVTILKDAASTALYGSSAGNGVVLINTKKAPQGKENTVNLHISQGFTKKGVCNYDQVGWWDYYPLQWEMLKNQYINGSGRMPQLRHKMPRQIFILCLAGLIFLKMCPTIR